MRDGRRDVLPVLDHGVDAAGGGGVARGEAPVRVPPVGAGGPGQLHGEGEVEEVHGPRQDDDVVHVKQEADDCRPISNACITDIVAKSGKFSPFE